MKKSQLMAFGVLAAFVMVASSQAATRDEARALLNEGKSPMEAVRAYESFASSTMDAGLVAERSLSLAQAGLNEAALQEMDRAFLLDPADDEVLFAGSTLLAYLGMIDASVELARPTPAWVTRQPLLKPRAGSIPHWDSPSSMHELKSAMASATELMQRGRYVTAADRMARVVASNPKDPTAWSGFAVALENLGAYHAASRAVAAELYLDKTVDGETRKLIQEHQEELARRAPVVKPAGIENALEGRYTLFAGGSLSGGAGINATAAVAAQAGKFLTNRLNVLVNTGYTKSLGFSLGLGGRYYQPLGTAPFRLTGGTRLELDTGADTGKFGWVISPGLSWFLGTSSLDLIFDLGLVGSQTGNRTLTVGTTFYLGGPF